MKKYLNKMNSFFEKYIFLIFVIIFLIMSYSYKYHKNSFYRPQSVHTWRQTDCASQAYNYFKHDKNFFKPEISLQCSDDFKTGY